MNDYHTLNIYGYKLNNNRNCCNVQIKSKVNHCMLSDKTKGRPYKER